MIRLVCQIVSFVFGAAGLGYLSVAAYRIHLGPASLRARLGGATGVSDLSLMVQYFIGASLLGLPLLIAAWGLQKWRRWGHILALCVSGFLLLSAVVRAAFGGIRRDNAIEGLASAVVLIWFLLPPVREQFGARKSLA